MNNDISLCTGGSCPHKELCLRYSKPVPSKNWFRQSWINPPFYFNQDGFHCPEYIENPPEVA